MEYSYNMQNGKDTKYLKMVSTAKHYADYDQEGSNGTRRQDFDANVTMLSGLLCDAVQSINPLFCIITGKIRWSIIGQHGDQQFKQLVYNQLCVHIMQLIICQVAVMIIL